MPQKAPAMIQTGKTTHSPNRAKTKSACNPSAIKGDPRQSGCTEKR